MRENIYILVIIETGNIGYTRRRPTKQKHNTMLLDTIIRRQRQIRQIVKCRTAIKVLIPYFNKNVDI
jgi:hypothetical protein